MSESSSLLEHTTLVVLVIATQIMLLEYLSLAHVIEASLPPDLNHALLQQVHRAHGGGTFRRPSSRKNLADYLVPRAGVVRWA